MRPSSRSYLYSPAPFLPGGILRQSLAILQLILAGCGQSDGPRPSPAAARGNVAGGTGIEGAAVSFIEASRAGVAGSLQPLEDLAASARFQARTDRNGDFTMELDPGRYFVYVTPAAGDDRHLPGGSNVRTSVTVEEGKSYTLNMILSEKPSSSATYVGSSTCLSCHAEHAGVMQTLHFLGLRKLTAAGSEPSSLQDLSRFPDSGRALEYYMDGNGDDNTGGGDGYGYRLSTAEGYHILLGADGNGYFQAFETDDGAMVSEKLYIPFTYGGEGRYRQLFTTRLDRNGRYTPSAADGSYYILPGQFSETAGNPLSWQEITVPAWVTYHPERWGAPTADGGGAGRIPAPERSFDSDCAGCHFTGITLTRNSDGLFQAHAVADPGGPLDLDGNGAPEEMNVGCERCHGPGSEHAATGDGPIVHPGYLPPGRANMICGQCHSRGSGNALLGGLGGGEVPCRNDPDTGEVEFVRAGISPAEFLGTPDGTGILPDFGTSGGFFNPIDFTTDSTASWRDSTLGHGGKADHSRRNRQQYLDHSRSAHASNSRQMLTCWDCHDPHGRERPSQVADSMDNNTLCLRCHAGRGDWASITQDMVDTVDSGGPPPGEVLAALDGHQTGRIFDIIGVAMHLGPDTYGNPAGTSRLGRCITCHMPRTARTAAWIEDDEGFVIRGDISSHTFDMISPRVSEAMALEGLEPVPNPCADCHGGLLRGAHPDYRFAGE